MKDRWLIYLAVTAIAYMLLSTTVGRLPCVFTDEVFFKAAGREWAATGRFAAPELRGALELEPPLEKVWLAYPPLYPLLFGCFVKAFGFGWRVCVGFDAVIHACLALVTFAVAYRLSSRGNAQAAFWAGLTVLPLGVTAGRPDEMAICFGMAGLLPLACSRADARFKLSVSSIVASGVLFGLCASASHPATVVLGLIALVFLVAHAGTAGRLVLLGIVWAGTAASVSALLIAPILVNYPSAYQQYLGILANIAERTRQPYGSKIANLMSHEARVLFFPVFGILILSLATVVRSLRDRALGRWILLWLGPFAAAAVLLIGVHSPCYTWFLGPYVLAAAVVTLTDPRLAPRPPGSYLARAAVVLLVLFGSIETVKQTIVLAVAPESQTMNYNERQVRDLIPPGRTVAAYDAWWVLGDDYHVYDFGWVPRQNWSEIDYVVAQDRPLPLEFEDYVQKHFRLIYDNRSRAPATVFGVPISRTHTGFGAQVFARRPTAKGSITQVVEP
jgi:hypothetical protein